MAGRCLAGTPRRTTSGLFALMEHRIRALAALVAACLLWPGSVFGQAAYRAPRTPDGHADLQGVWQALNTAVWNLQDHAGALGIPAGQGVVEGNEIPYLPSARAKRAENYRNRATEDPEAKCFMPGV